jgi:hypothetical protein
VSDSRVPESLSGCRAEARRLFKHLRGADPARARAAAERFVRLPPFRAAGAEGVLAERAGLRLKHALAVVAAELGFPTWNELVRTFEAPAGPDVALFHTPRHSTLLNRWFTNHAEARASLAAREGYLLPFGRQCFVTEAEGIRELGLDPADPDWDAVGFDLVQPRDRAAFARLVAKRRAAIARGAGHPSRAGRSA